MDANPDSELRQAQEALERLQEEHRPIKEQVGADSGMSDATRRLLVEHLEEEEQEYEERIAELQGRGTQARPAGGKAPAVRASSVGSMRKAGSGLPAARGTVGSLRPQ